MKIEAQDNAEFTRIGTLIEHFSVAMLTSIDGDGALISRPMSPLKMDANCAVWLFTDVRSAKVEQLRVINLTFSDPQRAIYVSLSGHGEIYAEHGDARNLWTSFAESWFPDGPDSSSLALLKLVPDAADYWDATHRKMVRVLGMASCVVSAEPIAMTTTAVAQS
ncbi:MAG: pyridoxamine 5'-phosphate oxidase family protein [Pseudomonadota bacterium]|nr:pyridoxamine 5'-phosphate oxidase family protein [Pseudomonadota bacterium]